MMNPNVFCIADGQIEGGISGGISGGEGSA